MGSSQNCVCCHRHRRLVVSLLFFLVSLSFVQVNFMAEGRSIPKLKKLSATATQKVSSEEEKVAVVMRNLIGSRPPKCEKKCSSCEHCEAVQVPVTKTQQQQGHKKSSHFHLSAVAYVNVRGDDFSNYKPMSWKCKCGNLILNPN